MNGQAVIQKKLGEKFAEAKLKNPSFSMRAFAKRLGVSHTTLSLILNGRRQISRKLAHQLVERMRLSAQETASILSLFQKKRSYPHHTLGGKSAKRLSQLTLDQFEIVSEWYHFALRALLKTANVQSSPEHSKPQWLGKRLGIKSTLAKKAIERMLRLGMIEKLADGRLSATDADFHSTDGVPSVAIRNYLTQHLDLARVSIARDPVDIRDCTSLVMAINPRRLVEAKAIIRRFRKDIENLLENGSDDPVEEVYSLAVQLFPITRTSDEPQ